MTALGTFEVDGTRRRLCFERSFEASPEDVWSALTDPERLARWLAPGTVGEKPGDAISLDFGDGGEVTGVLLRVERPHLLEYQWRFSGEEESIVRFTLQAEAAGTRLVLEHLALGTDHAVGYAAGWHAHLDALRDEIDGGTGSWDERFAAVLPSYRSAAAAVDPAG
jgi:uncharacterized protein YndB with AHSA1/START domain